MSWSGWLLLVGLGGQLAVWPFGSFFPLAAGPSASERQALVDLAREIRGTLVFGRQGHIWTQVIGSLETRDLGPGSFARWSADGRRIAVQYRRELYVMNADGSQRRKVTGRLPADASCALDFHPNGREIISLQAGQKGLFAYDTETGEVRPFATERNWEGEPALDGDGRRLAGRSQGAVWALDLRTRRERKVTDGCSSCLAPDGGRVAANLSGHKTMLVRDWETWRERVITATIAPDRKWDNQHWSNHADLLTAQGEDGPEEGYVVRVSTGRAIRVTFVGSVLYPDLFVGAGSLD